MIIAENLSETDALELETQLINKYDSVENGYNGCYSSEKHRINLIRCVETQEIFDNITAAANSINKHPTSLLHCLLGGLLTCGGKHWEYVANDERNQIAALKNNIRKNKAIER